MSTLKGVDPNGSQRAWDLYVKSRFIDTRNPGRALVLASGTPITNTLGEMFTVQRLMDYAALMERGLHEFDAWASTFGDTTTELELQPSGKYKPVSRFASFVNVPELIAMFRSFADVVMPEDLRQFVKVPSISTGKRQIITSKPTQAFKHYQMVLAARIAEIEKRDRPPSRATTSCSPSSPMVGMPPSICAWSTPTMTMRRTTSSTILSRTPLVSGGPRRIAPIPDTTASGSSFRAPRR